MFKHFSALTLLIACAWLACRAEQRGASLIVMENDPQLRFNNGVLLYAEQPLSGVVAASYANGQMKSQTEYSRGLQNGKSRMWYEDGKPYWERSYRNGKKHGAHTGWWPNGKLKFVYHFANGEHEGAASDWYETGQLAQRFQYEQGREVGLQQAWRENGKLYTNYVMKDGKRYGLFNVRLCYTIKNGEVQSD